MPLYVPDRPLVGRLTELDRLAAATGGGHTTGLAVLSGDAGIGKTRLIAALATRAQEAGHVVAVGHCVGVTGPHLAYLPLVELLDDLTAAEPDMVRQVAATHRTLAPFLPVEDHPAVDPIEDTSPVPDPGRIATAVHALLETVAAHRPVLVVVEDVHWADNSTRDLLTVLFTRGFTGPVGLLASYRADDLHRRHPLHETLGLWARLPQVTRIHLGRLPARDMRALIDATGGAPTSRAAVADIVDRADGNAFFAEELIAGGNELTGDLGRVLRLRVENLGQTARTVVQAMAVGGRRVSSELLSCVTGLDAHTLDQALHEATDHHILVCTAEDDIAFRHALLAESAYDDLLPTQRRRLHSAYVDTLTHRPDLGTAATLARHAYEAGERATAIAASRRAAEDALAAGGPVDALAHLERALAWTDPDDPVRDDITLRAAFAGVHAGNVPRAIHLLRDAIDHPGPRQDHDKRAYMLSLLVFRCREIDVPCDPVALTDEALALLDEHTPAEVRGGVLQARLQALTETGRYAETAPLADEIARITEEHGLSRQASEARAILARVVEAQQDTDAMGAHLEAVRAELAGGDDPIQVRVHHNLAGVYHRRGDLRGARDLMAQGRAIAERLGRQWTPWAVECRVLQGIYSFELGEWALADDILTVPPHTPELARAMAEAAHMGVHVARGDIDSEHLGSLDRWWTYDGLTCLLGLIVGIEVYGREGRVNAAIDVAGQGAVMLERMWGPSCQALVRLSAVLVGAVTGPLAASPEDTRSRALPEIARLVTKARAITTASDERIGAETRAWAARMEADCARSVMIAAPGIPPADGGPVDADQEVAAWRAALAAFESYGNAYETVRSRVFLAAALRRAGCVTVSREVATQAEREARALGAEPLLQELGVSGPSGPPGDPAAAEPSPEMLTRRERQVLQLVAAGLTNGQIGRRLFISTKTASVHVSHILAKLGVPNRAAAAAQARRWGVGSGTPE
ncbi:helix-turn-helix transcriptional regulator [Austwickia sp. TVS 96-490-7B]|uniref:helix-turn-helix transcriptional regulator n=1 Tax=Austwickia sp. TVS 96-490-7B TaxID=2830843 RepID=UPI001C56C928|nr:LuxR family transcriptional regulator [Austwickia sp. TVS 96-490-7B]